MADTIRHATQGGLMLLAPFIGEKLPTPRSSEHVGTSM
jgi:hypothetical protein